ncbi:hypothetical protein IscW_ISCW000291, partial [Ixodes scapularis]
MCSRNWCRFSGISANVISSPGVHPQPLSYPHPRNPLHLQVFVPKQLTNSIVVQQCFQEIIRISSG